ncbi:LysR family transcriptional regulator [Lactiplantibacillus pentosus]|uniref:LysR family transcriptional regulator n=2 Tax=Lactiplantibacillus pentosus TaxID=1589 RepID=A0AAX6LD28_LACPE|nr:LysR family transcriptional regulator [Lactiplantibacillus pentosus]MBU7496298.1 LysR family transcriptional regulator [Lactiplantibacillus pentosus]MDF2312444.1 LysR family transcriptional regulator [Lactiplantibacillus pentosus]WNN86321.1 LysR family transcriptional regulator [Lactiplantibacillus pentosus]CCB83642.1 putative malolactic regulator [Lactiplantibacillus pentosus MP-10]
MNTRDLDYFRALVDCQNYTMVARQFAVSQPAVTQAIHRLEKEFAVKLVIQDRHHQQTNITRAGHLLYKNAQQIQASLRLAHQEIDSAQQAEIRFGLPPIIGTLYFPQIAEKLLQNGLLQQLKITETGSDELLHKLVKGEINIALLGSYLPFDLPTVHAVKLGARPFSIIVSPQNSLATQTSIGFKDLGQAQFIGLDGKYVHPQAFQAYCDFAGVHPEVIYRTPDISWVKALVKANLGISMLVRDVVKPDDGVVCLDIEDQLPVSFNISVVTRTGYLPTDDEQRFIDQLLKMTV